ncbi:MAG: dihydroneopterin aldolase family protein [Methanomicrobiales archaeon]|nr:dihydroneopterin aldolase family protein [Methanomicrobiales archaeon]
MISDREKAAFEAGIKLGALYHQWTGTPVSPQTAASLETAMEKSVSLQPFVEEIRVRLVRERMILNPFGYGEVRGDQFEVRLSTNVNGSRCRAALSFEEGYPLMKILSLENTG